MSAPERTRPTTLVWSRPEPRMPAGRPSAGAADIARAAFAIADTEGLAALSVKRVANRLKLQPRAIERYLPGREDLLDLVLDAAFGEVELPATGEDRPWREQLRGLAGSMKAVLLRHPWLRSLAGTRPASGPNGLRIVERTLASFDGVDLPADQLMVLANTVLAFVYGCTPLADGHGDADTRYREQTAHHLAEAVASGQFPHLRELFDRPSPSADEVFAAGLEVVLDGIAAAIGRLAAVG